MLPLLHRLLQHQSLLLLPLMQPVMVPALPATLLHDQWPEARPDPELLLSAQLPQLLPHPGPLCLPYTQLGDCHSPVQV